MGLPMSRNLAHAGIAVRAWNRSRDKVEPLAGEGISVAGSPKEAADGAEVILTILTDTGAVLQSMDGNDGALRGAGPGTIWLQMSTLGEEGTERCAELASSRGLPFIDAPVLGTKQPAEQGQLVVLASGEEGLTDRVQPIFDAVAHRTIWVGAVGDGTRLKLVVNSWVLAVVEGGAETIALCEGLGLDPRLFFEAIEGGVLDLPYLRIKAKAIMERSFEPSFRLSLAAKDARLVEASARRRNLDLPLLSTIRQRLEEGAKEHGDEDLSATYLTSAPSSRVRV
jgi:3-hydroxyisobutyrate dehydrogenase